MTNKVIDELLLTTSKENEKLLDYAIKRIKNRKFKKYYNTGNLRKISPTIFYGYTRKRGEDIWKKK